ncbi:DUF7261 family protein [Halorussus litoreus]|uniref:DUF7261 family protein n=1 Tax=Halorussus litoreus TaxID=1710536 RepID=UPI0013008476|nr:hypothetical protein [Halorussus litoreus]
MADVSPEPDGRERWTSRDDEGRNRDRGQLILVTGLAVAVTLVALVLLLNTVIYTQNLATRGTGVEHGEAVAFRGETASGVGAVVDAENRAGYDDWEAVQENVTAGVKRYDNLSTRYSAERGTIADVEEDSLALSEGTILSQTDDSRYFTSAGGDADWLLIENVSSVRRFRATVSGEDLSDGPGGAFTVRLVSESDTREFYVYNDSEDAIAVSNDLVGSPPDGCTASGPEATIDLTAGTVGGTDCPELDYPAGSDEYNVTFDNGTAVTGIYELTVGLPPGDSKVKTGQFDGPAADDSTPRWGHAVYDAAFDLHFETATMEFHTRVRVAPGEPE